MTASAGTDPQGAARFLLFVLRWLRLVAATTVLAGVAGAVWGLSQPRTYSSQASFTPERSSGDRGGVASLAASLGISLGSSSMGESPQFYADVLASDEIVRRVASRRFAGPGSTDTTATLASLFGVTEPEPEAALVETARRLRRQTSVHPNPRTGIITIVVRSRSADLSEQLASAYLRSINEFNIASRHTRASAEREFVEGRLAAYQGELAAAESAYEKFLRANASIGTPDLQIQHDRHRREIAMLQQVVTSLAGAFEQARIDEVRSTPAIRVIDHPRKAVIPDARGAMRRALYFAVLGAALGFLLGAYADAGGPAGASRPAGLRDLLRRTALVGTTD